MSDNGERRTTDASPSTVGLGRAAVEALLEEYGDIQLSRIEGLPSVGTVSQTWRNRPKSNIVKRLMEKSGRTLDEIAEGLGCSKSYLNNKLHRDSFSVDDLVIIAYICGYAVAFIAKGADSDVQDQIQIDVEEYFSSYDDDALNRLKKHERGNRLRYEELKARVAQMKAEYGFED